MICIPTQIPQELCAIDDELKAIYHSKDSFCVWCLKPDRTETVLWKQLRGWTKKIE